MTHPESLGVMYRTRDPRPRATETPRPPLRPRRRRRPRGVLPPRASRRHVRVPLRPRPHLLV